MIGSCFVVTRALIGIPALSLAIAMAGSAWTRRWWVGPLGWALAAIAASPAVKLGFWLFVAGLVTVTLAGALTGWLSDRYPRSRRWLLGLALTLGLLYAYTDWVDVRALSRDPACRQVLERKCTYLSCLLVPLQNR